MKITKSHHHGIQLYREVEDPICRHFSYFGYEQARLPRFLTSCRQHNDMFSNPLFTRLKYNVKPFIFCAKVTFFSPTHEVNNRNKKRKKIFSKTSQKSIFIIYIQETCSRFCFEWI